MLQLLSYHLNIQRSVRFLLLQELIFQTLGSFLKVGLMKARIQKRHFLGSLKKRLVQKMYPYDGQKQKYYLVKLKKDAKININTEIPEFSEYKFVSLKEVYEHITFFKRTVYKQVLKYFKDEGYI